jgi:hypothetical protein
VKAYLVITDVVLADVEVVAEVSDHSTMFDAMWAYCGRLANRLTDDLLPAKRPSDLSIDQRENYARSLVDPARTAFLATPRGQTWTYIMDVADGSSKRLTLYAPGGEW